MSALDEQNTMNLLGLLGEAFTADQDALREAEEAQAALTGQSHSVTVREKVHVTHFVRFHDDWDFDEDAWVIQETDTHIRVADGPHHMPGELVCTFTKDRDLLVKRLPL